MSRLLVVAGVLCLVAGPARAQWRLDRVDTYDVAGLVGGSVGIGDVGGDGRTDVIVTLGGVHASGEIRFETLGVMRQTVGGELELAIYPLGASLSTDSLDVRDIDGDEDRDIVVGGDDLVLGYLGGGPVLEPAMILADVGGNTDVIGRGPDGLRDIAVGGRDLLDNLGMATFAVQPGVLGETAIDQALCDVDGDGRVDLVTVREGEATVRRFLPSGNFGDPRSFSFMGTPRGVECGDVDRDGFGDVIVIPEDQTAAFVTFGNEAAEMFETVGVDLDGYAGDAVVGGLDGLGDEGSGVLVIVMRNGTLELVDFGADRAFTMLTLDRVVEPTESKDSLAIGDVNGDRCGDIVVAAQDTSLAVYVGTGCPDDVEPIDAGVPDPRADARVCVVDPDGPDLDGDGVNDSCDLCPDVYDPVQVDYDDDGLGDACDPCASGNCSCACAVPAAAGDSSSLSGNPAGAVALLILGGLFAFLHSRRYPGRQAGHDRSRGNSLRHCRRGRSEPRG